MLICLGKRSDSKHYGSPNQNVPVTGVILLGGVFQLVRVILFGGEFQWVRSFGTLRFVGFCMQNPLLPHRMHRRADRMHGRAANEVCDQPFQRSWSQAEPGWSQAEPAARPCIRSARPCNLVP